MNSQMNSCDRLVDFVNDNRDRDLGISRQQLRQLQRADNEQDCDRIYAEVRQGGRMQTDSDGRIVVRQTAPEIRVDQADPQVTVMQTQPNVSVMQPQPEIIVRQPAPQVTVDIPQPEIIVRMAEPEVRVSQAQPRVQVRQPQPEIDVVQPEQQASVSLEQDRQAQVRLQEAEGQPNVQIQRSGQPNVRYESEEPDVRINQAEGQPRVRYEEVEGGQQAGQNRQLSQNDQSSQQTNRNRQAAVTDEEMARDALGDENRQQTAEQRTRQGWDEAEGQNTTGAVNPSRMRSVTAEELEGMEVVNARGNQLGDIDRLVFSTADNSPMAVIAHGGFLGLGEKMVAVPLEDLTLANDRLYIRGLTDDEIRAMPAWDENDRNYSDFERGQQARIGTRG